MTNRFTFINTKHKLTAYNQWLFIQKRPFTHILLVHHLGHVF